MALLYRDEVSHLLDLYRPGVTEKEIRGAIRRHKEKFGRIGFGIDRLVRNRYGEDPVSTYLFHDYEYGHEKINDKRETLKAILQDPHLNEAVRRGLRRAREVMPAGKYRQPTAVFLLGGRGTDARVMDHNNAIFGINFDVLYDDICNHGKELEIWQKVDHALCWIEEYVAHEGNHGFLEQVIRGNKHEMLPNHLHNAAFGEGIATWIQRMHLEQHKYTNEAKFWLELMDKAHAARTTKQRKEVLAAATQSSLLGRFNPRAVERIKKILDGKTRLTEKRYSDVVWSVFGENAGPAYHVGWHMWNTLAGQYKDRRSQIRAIRDIIAKGPQEFMERYREAAAKQADIR